MTDSRRFGARRVVTLESSLSFCPACEGLDDCEAGPALDELFPMTSGRAAVYVTFITFETGPGLRKPRGATQLHLGRLDGVQIDVVLPQLIAQRASPKRDLSPGCTPAKTASEHQHQLHLVRGAIYTARPVFGVWQCRHVWLHLVRSEYHNCSLDMAHQNVCV